MTCFDDEMVLGLVEGRLAAAQLTAADDHLDGCEGCRDLVAQLARAQPEHVLGRGHAIGRYVIGELVGTGAMGRVYSAWEPELDRRVAIKILHEAADGARERLVREAQAMARLDHPNIVGVHEVGTSAEGVYVAMALVDGETLRVWGETPRPWRDVVRVLIDVARGLAAVHAAGVIHRDIKPDNVIVGRDGRARLGDFGLARTGASMTGRPPTAGAQLARGTGDDRREATTVAGTPAYMAPEILRGGAATAASDQFAFGVTAFELLAGKRPYDGGTWAELSRSVERGAIATIRGVPAWLDAAIRRCLAGDPTRRFPSLGALGDHLAARLLRRRPIAWIAGAAGVAALASVVTWGALPRSSTAAATCNLGQAEIAVAWNPGSRGRVAHLGAPAVAAIDRWAAAWSSERDASCAARSTTTTARDLCLDGRRTELAALLERAGRPDVPAETADRLVDALAALSPAECRAARPGSADPVPLDPDRAAATRAIAHELPTVRAALALGDARPVVATITAIVERARIADHQPTLAEALLVSADAARATARLDDAAHAARDALGAAERGHDDLAAARAWIARVAIAGDIRDLTSAEDLAATAAAAIDRAGAPSRLVAQLLRLRALVAYNRGDFATARSLLLDARTRFAALGGDRTAEVSAVESSLGSAARAAGDLDGAEQHHAAALAIDRALRGDRHPDVARDLHNLAGVARLRGQLDRAVTLYDEALAIEIATRGEHSVEAGLTHNSLGLVKMERHDLVGARTDLEHARDALATAGHGDLAFVEHNLGLVAAARTDPRDALEHYARAAVIYARTIGITAPAPTRLVLDRARATLAVSGIAAARDDLRLAITGADRAGIAWIAEDARALLAANPTVPTRSPVVVEPVAGDRPVAQAAPAAVAPTPDPPVPVVPAKRDVGVYGSSQGW